MTYIFNIVKADYQQRTRSYSFLITLAVTVFMAYSFVPPNTAGYTTLSAAGYKGVYNSAWAGYVSGIMTTVMLSFYGFLLVNSGIKKDMDTAVGLIVATSPISNFKYLLCKQLSNYLVLLTIVAITLTVSIVVFFMRGTGYPFMIGNFILPYLLFAMPAMFVVAALAVSAEVFLPKRGILQFIAYFFLCGVCMALINSKHSSTYTGAFDPFGLSLITKSITQHINAHFHENIKSVSFGFIFNGHRSYRPFTWEGLNWSAVFIASRVVWMALALGLVYVSSCFFHRFDFKQVVGKKQQKKHLALANAQDTSQPIGIDRAALPALKFDFGVYPLIKTELMMLIRQGNKWLWLLNAGLWLAMCLVPINIAFSYLLPILLFLQVTRWSDLVTKEKTNRVHYFAYAAYKPLQRVLPAQILAGILLGIGLAMPVLLRCALALNAFVMLSILNGIMLIVLSASALGSLTGGKKLFEVLFFLLTYAVINQLPVADYLGSLPHQNTSFFILGILAVNVALASISMASRNYQARHL